MKKTLILVDFPFWEKSMGNAKIFVDQINNIPGIKTVIYLGRMDKRLVKTIETTFKIDKIYCCPSLIVKLNSKFTGFLLKIFRKAPKFFMGTTRYSCFYKSKITRIIDNENPNIVILHYIWNHKLVDKINRFKVLVTHDIQSDLYSSWAKTAVVRKKISEHEEMAIIRKFNRVICLTNEDKNKLEENGIKADVLPPIFDVPSIIDRSVSKVKNIMFIGGIASFNKIAIEWFIKEVFGKLDDSYTLNIYGKVSDIVDLSLVNDRIHLHGFVANSNSIYYENSLAINPSFVIGGIKIKNVEALAHGIPLITTTAAATGFFSEQSQELPFLVCDTPEQFIEKITLFFSDDLLGKKLSKLGYEYVKNEFGPVKHKKYFQALLEDN